jgi:hypothetical protein
MPDNKDHFDDLRLLFVDRVGMRTWSVGIVPPACSRAGRHATLNRSEVAAVRHARAPRETAA